MTLSWKVELPGGPGRLEMGHTTKNNEEKGGGIFGDVWIQHLQNFLGHQFRQNSSRTSRNCFAQSIPDVSCELLFKCPAETAKSDTKFYCLKTVSQKKHHKIYLPVVNMIL